jgi:parvulin-like peptidyl-prolyl isomerase
MGILLSACSESKEKVKLEPGTPQYLLAKDISEVASAIDPDSNKVIINTEYFEITTGEVIQVLHSSFGSRAGELKKMEAGRIRQIINLNAEKIAEKKLALRAAQNAGFSISDTQLDSLLQKQYTHVGGEEVFLDHLEKRGLIFDYVKEDMANSFIIDNYLKSVFSNEVMISDKEVQDRYRQLLQKDRTASVRHILMMTQGKNDIEKQEIYKKMKKILARAKKGEDFASLAKIYSEDPGSKRSGGLYKDFERGAMVKPFEDAAFSVPIGEVSEIVETRYGYHILKVIDRKKESRTFEECKSQIEKELGKNKEKEFFSNHMNKLKEDAKYEKIQL